MTIRRTSGWHAQQDVLLQIRSPFKVHDFRSICCQLWCFWIDQNGDMTVCSCFSPIFDAAITGRSQAGRQHEADRRLNWFLSSISIPPSPSAILSQSIAAVFVTSFCSHGHFPASDCHVICWEIAFYFDPHSFAKQIPLNISFVRRALIHGTLICKRESLESKWWKPLEKVSKCFRLLWWWRWWQERRRSWLSLLPAFDVIWGTDLPFVYLWNMRSNNSSSCFVLSSRAEGMSSLICWLILNLNAILRTNYFVCIPFMMLHSLLPHSGESSCSSLR